MINTCTRALILFALVTVPRRSFGQLPRPADDTPSISVGRLGIALGCDGCDGAAGSRSGVLIVRSVAPGGAAARLLTPGDTIVSVNRTITAPPRMRIALMTASPDSALEFEMRGARGHYTVKLRKQPDRLVRIGAEFIPLKYQGTFAGVAVDVLTPGVPVVSRDSSGALVIQVGEHAVRLRPATAAPPRATAP